MIKRKALYALTGVVLATTSITTQATIIDLYGDLGIATSAGTINCPSSCFDVQYEHYFGSDTSSSYNDSYGTAQSLGSLSGSDFLPDLKAYAQSEGNNVASAQAWSAQGYNYSGTDTMTYTIDFNLHGSVTGNAGLRADVAILIGSEMIDLYDWIDFGTGYYEPYDDNERAGWESTWLSGGIDENSASSISFDLDAGDSFFVLSNVEAWARGGTADALNTLTLNFEDSTGLQAVATVGSTPSVEVPEPSSYALFLIALSFMVRRKITK